MKAGASVWGWMWLGITPGGGLAAGMLTRVAGSIVEAMLDGVFAFLLQDVYEVTELDCGSANALCDHFKETYRASRVWSPQEERPVAHHEGMEP